MSGGKKSMEEGRGGRGTTYRRVTVSKGMLGRKREVVERLRGCALRERG